MNTQEKELNYCTTCAQMTNHSGETCLKHTPDTEKNAYSRGYKQGRFDADMDRLNEEKPTPDTEWVRVLQDKARDYFLLWDKEAKKLRVKPDELFFHLIDPLVEELVQQIRDARDTYWKERVRKDIEAYKNYHNPIGDTFNRGRHRACNDLLDNLSR